MQRFLVLLQRELRDRVGFALTLAVCVPALSIAAQLTWLGPGDGVLIGHWVLPGLVALVLAAWGADIGARELEEGTDLTLARLPAARMLLFAAKLAALVLGGALLAGWLLVVEIAWRGLAGWPLEAMLHESLQRPLLLQLAPVLGLASCTLALILGRTFTGFLAAVVLCGAGPLALVQASRSFAGVADALKLLATLDPDSWSLVLVLAFTLAAAGAYRPGRRQQGRAFAGALLGGLLIIVPNAVAAGLDCGASSRTETLEVFPSRDGRYLALQVVEFSKSWWGARRRSALWLQPVDGDAVGEPRRIPGEVEAQAWNATGQLELYDRQRKALWAWNPATDERHAIAPIADQWWSRRSSPTGDVSIVAWQGHELELPRREGSRRPLASEPGLVVGHDRERAQVWSARMGEEPRVIWSAVHPSRVLPSPYHPIVLVVDTQPAQLTYLDARNGDVLAGPFAEPRRHVGWCHLDDVFAVTSERDGDQARYHFHGERSISPMTLDLPHDSLLFVGEARVVTFGKFVPTSRPGSYAKQPHAVLRELDGTPIATLWE